MRNKIILITAILLCAGRGFAQWGEVVATYSFKGFSPDLKYAAYEMVETVPWPGRDITRTSIFIIDVDKNAYAAKHFEYDVDSADQPGFKPAYDAYYKNMKTRFGITGTNLGNPVHMSDQDTTHSFYVDGQQYSIRVTSLPVPNRENESEVMVKVDLVHNGKATTLQAPEKAPDSWGVTVDYQLLSAYTMKNKITIFVQYRSSVIELPDRIRQMVVTGVLK